MTFNHTASLHCTCDDVFDTLTRGPFPTGDVCIDQPTERHLLCCHECRALAEAFRPATEVLEESLPVEMSSDLPVYQGAFWDQQAVSWDTAKAAPKTRVFHYSKPFAVLAASILVLFFVATWGSSASLFSSQLGSSTEKNADTQELAQQRLLSLALPVACVSDPLKHEELQFVHAGHLSDLQCCSECHNASASEQEKPFTISTVAPITLLAIVDSCRACHAQPGL